MSYLKHSNMINMFIFHICSLEILWPGRLRPPWQMISPIDKPIKATRALPNFGPIFWCKMCKSVNAI